MALQLRIEKRWITCSVSSGDVVTEDMSVTPGCNNDMLIPEALEPDVTLDCCKWAQTGQISSWRMHIHTIAHMPKLTIHTQILSFCLPRPSPQVFLFFSGAQKDSLQQSVKLCEAISSAGRDTLRRIYCRERGDKWKIIRSPESEPNRIRWRTPQDHTTSQNQ